MIALVLATTSLAATVALTPSDGVAAVGPREPGWVVLGTAHPLQADLGASSRELDAAWAERRQLENAAARQRVDALIVGLRPVIDVGQRDLLQRALFLRGVLDIDDAGGIERITNGVVVAGQRVPPAWEQAISVSPGAAAPATADAAYAVQIYDVARTALTQAGGLALDPSASGAGEVRVDGLPVTQEITLLPGQHTLSWHPVGADPVVLEISVGSAEARRAGIDEAGYDAGELKAWLSALAAVQQGGHLEPALRAQLHDALGTPAVLMSTARPTRRVWLVDGPARWGAASFDMGVGVGGWGFAATDGPSVACDGTRTSAGNGLGVAALEASVTTGPVRLRAGGGLTHSFGPGFAAETDGVCASGVQPDIEMVTTTPWGWASVGRRYGLSTTRELEPFLRVGGTGTHAVVQIGGDLRFIQGPWNVDLRLAAGPAFNVWSGPEAHLGVAFGLETVLSRGAAPRSR